VREPAPAQTPPATLPDATAGRTASPSELRRALTAAPAAYLAGALENPALGKPELLLLLLNRRAEPAQLERVARDARWRDDHQVRRRLALHPRTPVPLARRLLGGMFWKDLADLCDAAGSAPVVRRQAESRLKALLPELALGQRIALARRSGSGLLPTLLADEDPAVLRALLSNPKFGEAEARRLARAPGTPAGTLDDLARHHTWRARSSVRLALVRNPRTPLPAALGLLPLFCAADLQRIVEDDNVRTVLRVGAERRLDETLGGPAGRAVHSDQVH